MTVESIRPLLAVSCPAVCAFIILLYRKQPNIRESCTIIASIIQFSIIILMAPIILEGNVIKCHLLTICPGIVLSYKVDAFGLIFAITSSCLWILVSFFSIGYMRALKEHAQTRFYFMFALAIFSAVSIAMSGNLITFYVFFEALTLSTYWLVAHNEDKEAFFAGHKYLTYLLISGWCFFTGVVLVYSLTGTTDFASGGILTSDSASKFVLMVLFALFMLGMMKAAWMPFHSWLPTAMVAPTPVSALLHAVAVVKAGVFGIIRIVCYVYGVDLMHALGLGLVLACIASFTLIVANFMAIGQDNLKRLLAYSTINQLALIIFGVALLSPMSITGAMIHIPFHGFMKITLFLCAGAILAITGKKNISEMAGLGRTMPITMTAFTIGAMGMCSIPPAAGFISKWYICLGSIQSGQIAFLFVAIAASLLDLVYFFPVIRTVFFKRPAETKGGEREIRRKETGQPIYLFMVIPLAITGIFSIIFCLFPNTFNIFDLVRMAVRNLFGGV
ncbi:MAG: monovalent cation/H+ antiporter subunit D family protein [Desulfobacterales bacterium]|nr:monovalent cation/H+ antiporter subunit D family protein [Desulfobacterales bacterium]MBL7207559.1 monovalent cation/H+ antiporter subunit D family protein [Desulfobacterales bacterium]